MYFEEFEIGIQFNIDNVAIDKNDMLDFAKKYDCIPLHTDEEYAKKTILTPQIIYSSFPDHFCGFQHV